MARIGLSITKSTAFRNSTQEFSNVYYYDIFTLPTESEASTIIDNMVALEKTFHGTNVTFVRARLWSQTGTQAGNQMIIQKNLTGTGARSTANVIDKERAWLFRLRAGVDTRGNPVYLRKWYHACAEFVASQGIASGVGANTSGWSTAERAAQVSAMNAIGNANNSNGALVLCSKGGRIGTTGETWQAHPFLEHHQLGDQWRAQ